LTYTSTSVPFASYTDGWGTPAFSDGNRSVYFGPLKALYFRNINRMGLSKNPLIRLLIRYIMLNQRKCFL